MFKFITCIYLVIVVILAIPTNSLAQNPEADSSAALKGGSTNTPEYDYRIEKLEKFLNNYNSPLTPYSDVFVFYADLYGIDYRLVPAIAGVESTFGKRIPKRSFNAYGWANGEYRFKSWPDSIKHVTMTLRTKYFDRGATNINSIAKRYAPPSRTWGSKVKFFMSKIDTVPSAFDIII